MGLIAARSSDWVNSVAASPCFPDIERRCRGRRYSRRTEQAYVDWIRRFTLFYTHHWVAAEFRE